MSTGTIGARFQVVIPSREREEIGLKPHTQVSVDVREDCIIVQPLGGRRARGIGAELRDGVDATDYVRMLRSEWEARRP